MSLPARNYPGVAAEISTILAVHTTAVIEEEKHVFYLGTKIHQSA